jgi:hypothetical protein
MAEKTLQTYANHVRFHPPFHFFLIPGGLVLIILTIVNAVRHYEQLEAWILLWVSILLAVAAFLLRTYALRVQDRLIRLEERQRLGTLLSAELGARIEELTEAQLIAIRFASDGEVPALVERVLAAKMPARDIKKAIVTWRADTFRV